jgi:hypothetical protein
MAQAEQDQLTRQVGRALLSAAGADWQQVRAEYRSAGRHIEVDVFVKGPDGVERSVRPPQEVVDGLGRLRQGMYRPGRGTWLSALYVLDPPSAFSAEFEPDAEPRWRRVPPPVGFADELRFFPRADESIPDWLRQRAGLPPARPAEGGENPPGPRPQGPPPGTPTPAHGMPQQHGTPTPPPGLSQPTPPQGMPTPPPGIPTPPPGIPATPYGNQGPASPPRGFQGPGVPAGPYGGVPATPYGNQGDDQRNR